MRGKGCLGKTIYLGFALVTVVGALLAVYALLIEPYRLQVTQLELPFLDLPNGMEGLRIVQLSDTHIRTMGDYERRVLARLHELQPDMIVLTGDLVENASAYSVWSERVAAMGEFLAALPSPRYGVWVVRGNADLTRYGGHNDLWVREVQSRGVNLLVNETARLEIGGSELYMIGTDFATLPPDFSADWRTVFMKDNIALAAGPSNGNSFTHYMAEGWPQAEGANGYEFSGRLQFTDRDDGIGVLVGSRLPWGEDVFYRVRRYQDAPAWDFAPRGAEFVSGNASSGVQPEPNRWYRFRVRWERTEEQVHLQARFWLDGETEPTSWPIDCVARESYSDSRARGGAIGFWAVGPGWKYFDDLEVWPLDAAPSSDEAWYREDFERYSYYENVPQWLDYGANEGNLAEALQGVPRDAFSILLTHSPSSIMEAGAAGIDLVLSGHTHGGQIKLPIIGPLYAPADYVRKYSEGLFRYRDSWLYVNRGIGTRALPVRFLCPPEITVITLRRE